MDGLVDSCMNEYGWMDGGIHPIHAAKQCQSLHSKRRFHE